MNKAPLIILLVLSLGGCASDRAYREGERLLAQGQTEAGLRQLEQALKEAPNDVQIRTAYLRAREAQIERLFAAAEAAQQAGREAEAEARSTRDEAVQASEQHVGRVSDAVSTMLQRVDAMEAELGALVESLRTGANRLQADLTLLTGSMSDLYGANAPAPRAAAPSAPARSGPATPPAPVAAPAGAAEEAAPAASSAPVDEAAQALEEAPEPEPEPEPAPEPEPVPLPEPLPSPIDPPSFQPGTVLQLLDVSDPAAPQVVQTTELEGNVVTARVVDGVARVVLSTWPDVQPMLDDVAVQGGAEVGRAAIAESVGDTGIGDWLPAFRTTVADDAPAEEAELVACEDVLMPEVNAGLAQTSILRVDFEDGFDPADTTTVVAEATAVYASTERLYVAANRWAPPTEDPMAAGAGTTAVHAFDLTGDGAAAHLGAGEVPGHVLNQYSLSEHEGHLRIATTEMGDDEQPSSSAVRVLRLDGDGLEEVGAVTGLGLTETIQSVRFMGPVGYVVTFRQTDPLYVIDLADPSAPRAVGELKIPGFSSYLHPVGEGRLVGIGRDADDEGRDRGLLVSLFDVSDPTKPTQLQTWTRPDAWSQAGGDPKAFLWWAPESSVVVPYEGFSGGFDERGVPGEQVLGMAVLEVGDDGIEQRALVRAEGRYPSRAVVVDDRLWSLFDGGVVVSDFADPAAGTFSPYR